MHKTKTMICLSTALAMALGGAGLPAAAMAQEAVGSAGIATVTSMAVSMIDEADFDKDAKVEIAVQRALAQLRRAQQRLGPRDLAEEAPQYLLGERRFRHGGMPRAASR